MDWFPLWNSLRISAISTIITFFLGLFCAHWIAKAPRIAKSILDTVLTLPLILPPTVIGFFILVTVGPKGPIGLLLRSWVDYTVTMKWQASVIAVVIVTFPLMYRTARGAFEHFDQRLFHAGQTLGLTNFYIFWRIVMPNCRQGILAGTVLAFARGLGEYGATSMVSGYIANRTATISTTVAYYWQTNQEGEAYRWVLLNLLISFSVMVSINFLEKRQKNPLRSYTQETV
ncbi:molybdate ABC transporter permease subunit [Oscillospiraceae bacterium MB08-C2-2]|nr:molybdate ABC transporter permease subunit [Oscillospiraceae bacterium MB08-C2-2]